MNADSTRPAITDGPRSAWDRLFSAPDREEALRLAVALLIPVVAFALQWFFWSAIKPYVWFLFFPAVFFSSRLGGLRGGLLATSLSAVLVWYYFIPPPGSFRVTNPISLVSIAIFVGMGVLFSLSHDRLRRAHRETAEALQTVRNANEQLQAAHQKITALYEKTRELDELKTRFFANLSHELRTPLTLILGSLSKRRAAADPAAPGSRDLLVVERNARLLYRNVCDLLDVAKLQARRMELLEAPTDLAQLLRSMASQFDSLAAERQIHLLLDAPASLLALADAGKWERILLNLISNAFKFTPSGGTIELRLRTETTHAILEVEDTGPGIPAALRRSIFEPFRQVHDEANRTVGGTGLGLAIVHELVVLHGGTVVATEAKSGGARFIVTLPLKTPSTAPAPNSNALPVLDQEIRRQALDELRPVTAEPRLPDPFAAPDTPLVLIVEDHPDLTTYIAQILSPHCRIATAADGDQGFQRTQELRPDLVLTDLMMPRRSGNELLAMIRGSAALKDIPVVILSARDDDAERVRLLRAGAQDYLTKPFSAEELRARVTGILRERHHARQELQELNQSLEERFHQRTAELRAANQELDAFAYAVSHDLRAPLRALSGFSQALIEDHAAQLPAPARQFLDEITLASRHMGELINGLLRLSRSTRGERRHDAIDLSAQATRLLSQLAQATPERQVAWSVAPGLTAEGDVGMIESVLSNLLDNAWKYTLGTATPVIRVYFEQADDRGWCVVADNGAGFDPKHAARLFQPFQRLHRQDEFPGLGIGLATVHRIVTRHGGLIRATARPGQGATFSFSLPRLHGNQSPRT